MVTLYVPATVAVVLAVVLVPAMPGPVHVYDTGSVLLKVTPIATTLFVHVIEFVIAFTVACGTSVDELTATVDVLAHPDVGCVTTKV
jgi:hypothetical protein